METSAGVFDAHLHVVDPRFPLVANHGFVPEPFTVADYRAETAGLGITGGAVVAGSFQGLDRGFLRAALADLGPGFVGVAQVPADISDAEVRELDALGVRAIRVNLRRGGSAGREDLVPLGLRVHDLVGWHVELYVDATDLPDLEPDLVRLPRVVVDHLGLSAAGLPALLAHVARGGLVKATGFGRLDMDIPATLRRIAAESPHALLAGTDLPSTRAPRRFAPADLELIREALGPIGARAALGDNARALYRPRSA